MADAVNSASMVKMTGKRFISLVLLKSSALLFASAFVTLFALSDKAYSDMGRVYATDAKVSEESQKAIILHNLDEEVLILGTDLKADKDTGLIRFIPFPAEPVVRLAPEKSFAAVTALIKDHGLKFLRQSKGGPPSEQAVDLRFNQKLGSHDIATIKINDASGFRKWVNEFFEKKGLPQKNEYPEIEGVVDDYVKRGIVWFVFDFVGVTDKTHFIEPVEYRFKTRELYYPLKTSNTFGGYGGIDLILITPGALCSPLDYSGCLGVQQMRATTSSRVTAEELKAVYPDAGAFYGNQNTFVQLVSYRGIYKFTKDIFADLSKAEPHAVGHTKNEGRIPIMKDVLREFNQRSSGTRCDLKPDGGPCKGIFRKYYYDSETRRCEEFAYGGCAGAVPFDTKEACKEICEGKRITPQKEESEFQQWMPEGRFFSVLIPPGWKRRESDLMKEQNRYEMRMYAPEHGGIEYLTVEIAYYAEAHRTPERFIYDLMNPTFNPRGEERSPLKDVVVSGKKATSFEIKTPRSPLAGMKGRTINSVKRYVICPDEKGFFVLLYDSPANIAEENRWIFERMLSSFRPSVPEKTDAMRKQEISDDEYKVYTDFFSTKEMPKIKLPQFFGYVVKGRTIYEKTLINKKVEQDSLNYLDKKFGNTVATLIEDYRNKNVEAYALKDSILVPGLGILSEQKMKAARNSSRLSDVPPAELSGIVYLSMVEFNSEKSTALFYVSQSGSAHTSYFVLMDKEDNKWVLKNALMDSMLIY